MVGSVGNNVDVDCYAGILNFFADYDYNRNFSKLVNVKAVVAAVVDVVVDVVVEVDGVVVVTSALLVVSN